MSCVVSISAADPHCDELPTVPHHTVIYAVDKSDPRHWLLIGRGR